MKPLVIGPGRQRTPLKQVFDKAQEQLRVKFGMEMVELPLKEDTSVKTRLKSKVFVLDVRFLLTMLLLRREESLAKQFQSIHRVYPDNNPA